MCSGGRDGKWIFANEESTDQQLGQMYELMQAIRKQQLEESGEGEEEK